MSKEREITFALPVKTMLKRYQIIVKKQVAKQIFSLLGQKG